MPVAALAIPTETCSVRWRENTCARTVGRLVEIRLDLGYRSVTDVNATMTAMDALVAGLAPYERIITAADWRDCTVMGIGTADRAVVMLARRNPQTLRSACLIRPGSPTAVMQLFRVVSESHTPARQVFTSPEPMVAWLAEVTTPPEQTRLLAFLARE
jgi:hypothetical protein